METVRQQAERLMSVRRYKSNAALCNGVGLPEGRHEAVRKFMLGETKTVGLDFIVGLAEALEVSTDEVLGVPARAKVGEGTPSNLEHRVAVLERTVASLIFPGLAEPPADATARDFRGGLSDVAHAAAAQPRQDPAARTKEAAKPARRKRTG